MKYWLAISLLFAATPYAFGQTTEVKPLAAYGMTDSGTLAKEYNEIDFVRYVLKQISGGYWVRDAPFQQEGVEILDTLDQCTHPSTRVLSCMAWAT